MIMSPEQETQEQGRLGGRTELLLRLPRPSKGTQGSRRMEAAASARARSCVLAWMEWGGVGGGVRGWGGRCDVVVGLDSIPRSFRPICNEHHSAMNNKRTCGPPSNPSVLYVTRRM